MSPPILSSGMSPGAPGARCLAGSCPKLVLAGDRGGGLWGAGIVAAACCLVNPLLIVANGILQFPRPSP